MHYRTEVQSIFDKHRREAMHHDCRVCRAGYIECCVNSGVRSDRFRVHSRTERIGFAHFQIEDKQEGGIVWSGGACCPWVAKAYAVYAVKAKSTAA